MRSSPKRGPKEASAAPAAAVAAGVDVAGQDAHTETSPFLQRFLEHMAPDYDKIENLLVLGRSATYRRQALVRAGLRPGMQVLDVACGTGLLAREALGIVGPAGRVVGVDPSAVLMAQAQRREPGRAKALAAATLLVGRAEDLPRPDASANFLSLGFALLAIQDLRAAFAEFRRVLCPGGRLLMVEFTRPQGVCSQIALKAYMRCAIPLVTQALGRAGDAAPLWRYCSEIYEACGSPRLSPPNILGALEAAGFVAAQRHVHLGMFAEYTATVPVRA
jgi:demethylmenaquinone methyltransferase / 2-methoxy-6-polyprenyl-1,4-benzoquinol methylase